MQLYPPVVPQSVVQGQVVCVVVQHSIAPTALDGQNRTVPALAQLTFSNVAGLSATYTVNDVTSIGSSPLRMLKEVSVNAGPWSLSSQAKPGDELEYRITITNDGHAAISSVKVSDTVPAYTTFKSATAGTPLPTALGTCTKTTPANAAAVPCSQVQSEGGTGQIQWSFSGVLPQGEQAELRYTIKVAP